VVGVAEVALEVEHADRAPVEQERRGQLAARLGTHLDVAAVGAHVGDDHRLAGLGHPSHQPLPHLELDGLLRDDRASDLAHQRHLLGLAIDQVDGGRVVVDHLVERLEDGLDHLLEIERRRQRLADLEQHLLLERAPLDLLVEQRVVERERHVLGRHLEPVEVGAAERFLVDLVETFDRAERLAAPVQRHYERRAEVGGRPLDVGTGVAGRQPQRLPVDDGPARQPLAARHAMAGRRGTALGRELLRHEPRAAAARDPDAHLAGADQPPQVAGGRAQQIGEVVGGVERVGRGRSERADRVEGDRGIGRRRLGGAACEARSDHRRHRSTASKPEANRALKFALIAGGAGADTGSTATRFPPRSGECPRNTSASVTCSSKLS
jgi:hypothetical protein